MLNTPYVVGYIIYSRRNATSSSITEQDDGICAIASDEVKQEGVKGVSMEGEASDVTAFRDTETGLPRKGAYER
jgi:hypothetical protein